MSLHVVCWSILLEFSHELRQAFANNLTCQINVSHHNTDRSADEIQLNFQGQ